MDNLVQTYRHGVKLYATHGKGIKTQNVLLDVIFWDLHFLSSIQNTWPLDRLPGFWGVEILLICWNLVKEMGTGIGISCGWTIYCSQSPEKKSDTVKHLDHWNCSVHQCCHLSKKFICHNSVVSFFRIPNMLN